MQNGMRLTVAIHREGISADQDITTVRESVFLPELACSYSVITLSDTIVSDATCTSFFVSNFAGLD
jgi:hypothetical protein